MSKRKNKYNQMRKVLINRTRVDHDDWKKLKKVAKYINNDMGTNNITRETLVRKAIGDLLERLYEGRPELRNL